MHHRLLSCRTDLSPKPHSTCPTTVWASWAPRTCMPQTERLTTHWSPLFSFVSCVSKQHNSTWSSEILPFILQPGSRQSPIINTHRQVNLSIIFSLKSLKISSTLSPPWWNSRPSSFPAGVVLHLPRWPLWPPVFGPLIQSPNYRQHHFFKMQIWLCNSAA